MEVIHPLFAALPRPGEIQSAYFEYAPVSFDLQKKLAEEYGKTAKKNTFSY